MTHAPVLRARPLIHRGTVEVKALWWPAQTYPEEAARAHILEIWQAGATVQRCEAGLLLKLREARRMRCEAAPGYPLVETRGALAACPEAEGLLRGEVVVLCGGQLERLSAWTTEDPSAWIDLAGFEVAEARALAADPAPVAVAEAATEGPSARALLGRDEPAPAEARAALRAIEERGHFSTDAGGDEWSSPRAAPAPRARLLEWFSATLLALFSRFARPRPEPTPSRALELPPSDEPGLLTRSWRRLRTALEGALLRSRLARVLGRKHERYLRKMLEMFESGDYDEALRHAIPLGGQGTTKPGLPLSVPERRGELKIVPAAPAGSGSSLPVVDDLYEHMRRLYRQAFERLVAQGRIEDAAFLLAELLREDAEAVAFLEQHGKLRLAAELAEARKLAPGLVVRQWMLAGDWERGALLARRHDAYHVAISALESRDPDAALALREDWARTRAEKGDFAGAVEVAWPALPSMTRRVQQWLRSGVDIGGVAGARLLVRWLELEPEQGPELRQRALSLLEERAPESATTRVGLAEALLQAPKTEQTEVLARAALRALLRDQQGGAVYRDKRWYQRLADAGGDATLRADLPAIHVLDATARLRSRSSILRVRIESGDVGLTPIHDAAWLPDGKLVLACGEAGLEFRSPKGQRLITRLPQPAHHLVVSDNGNRAIALAPRGDVFRLARIDLLARRAEHWCEAKISSFAGDFDGLHWFISAEERVQMLDVTAAGLRADWDSGELRSMMPPMVVRGEPRQLTLTLFDLDSELRPEPWLWTYDLPGPVLRSREPARKRPGEVLAFAPSGNGKVYAVQSGPEGVTLIGERREVPFDTPASRVWLEARSDWLAVVSVEEGVEPVSRVQLFSTDNMTELACFELLGASRPGMRFQDRELVVWDERGRLFVLDMLTGQLWRDLRL